MSRAAEFLHPSGDLAERGCAVGLRIEAGHGTIAGRVDAGGLAGGEHADRFLVNRERGADGDAPEILTLARGLAFAPAVNVGVVAAAIEQDFPGDLAARFGGVIGDEHAEETFAAHALLQLPLHIRRQLPSHIVRQRQLQRRLWVGLDQLFQKRAPLDGQRHTLLHHFLPCRCGSFSETSGPCSESCGRAGGLRRLHAGRRGISGCSLNRLRGWKRSRFRTGRRCQPQQPEQCRDDQE